MALNLAQSPQPCREDATEATRTSKPERGEETEVPEVWELEGTPTGTLVREHLARASLVMESAHEEEIVVGKEEGPSEEVPMIEPME